MLEISLEEAVARVRERAKTEDRSSRFNDDDFTFTPGPVKHPVDRKVADLLRENIRKAEERAKKKP